jgi:Beige/BEACH domain/PH domain associated with Beige/BEACH
MSLNALQMLSPLTELASLNVRRLRELLLSQEKVSPYTTPVDDWLLAALLHITVNLQRVASSLFPIFHKIGLDVPLLTVPIMGPESARETYEAAFRDDSAVFSALAGEEDTVAQLEGLFDSSEGAALIKYSKDCMHLLLTVLQTRRPLLEKALEPRVFDALVLFSERISYDMNCQSSDRSGSPRGSFQPINESEASPPTNGATIGGGVSSGDLRISERTDSAGAAAVFESPCKAPGGEPTRTPSMIAPLSRMKNWYMGGGNGKESPAHDGIIIDRGSGKSSGQATPSLSATNSLRDMNSKERMDTGDAMRDQGDGMGVFMRRELRSQSEGSDSESSVCSGSMQSTAVIQTINRTYFSEADRHISQEVKETDRKAIEETAEDTIRPLLRWLKLLRDPYLKMNALRSVGVVKSVTALEHHEAACAKGFAEDLIALRTELEEHRDLSKKSAEEMTELRELSSTIVVSLSCTERSRQQSVRSNDSMLLKKVASNWHDCLSTFEMDWSPWADDLSGNKMPKVDEDGRRLIRSGCRIDGVSEYEISELRDSRMRRMILTRAADPVDHRDSAYREGKQRGSWNKDASFPNQRDHSASFTTQRASFLQLDLSKIRSIGGAAWGDDSDLADGMGSSVHGDLPGSPNSGPGSVREEVNGGGLGGAGMGIIGGLGALVFTSGTAERRPDCSYVFQWAPEERMQAMFTVTQVRLTLSILTVSTATCNTFNLNIMPLPSSVYTQVQLELMISGVLVLTNKTLYFHPNKIVGGLSTNKKPLTDHRWHIDRLLEAYGRRFLLQNCAIELFFADSPEVYVAFSTLAELQRFFRCLKRQNVPNLHASTSRSLDPRVVFANSPWTDLWRRRLISNFEYLMRLNILAGRSYNDITQYPVFPWIIADYTSEVLDLHDPASFRDLSKPVGALNPVRLAEIKERYDSFDSDIMPPFMYGSHYSSAGVVIHYMMRQEPFTTMFVNLQGGKFDCPDRVFFDIKSTWDCCNKDRSDVKELIVSTL